MHRRTDDGSRMNVWLICNHLPMDFLWQMNEWANVKSIENCINRMTGIATHHGWLVQTKRPKMHCMYYMYTNKKKMFEKEAEMNVECTLISPEIRYFANNHRNRTTYELWNRNENANILLSHETQMALIPAPFTKFAWCVCVRIVFRHFLRTHNAFFACSIGFQYSVFSAAVAAPVNNWLCWYSPRTNKQTTQQFSCH